MLKIHVLNVGHGDCIVVEFPSGRLTVVDINRSAEMDNETLDEVLSYGDVMSVAAAKALVKSGHLSYDDLLRKAAYDIELTDPIDYIAKIGYTIRPWRFISTHPHMDHLSGLAELRSRIGFTNAWVLQNSFTQNMSKLTDSQKLDWQLYQQLRAGNVNGVTVVRPGEGSQQDFWQQDGIHILAPTDDMLTGTANPNDISYVLLIKYGTTKVVLGGDAETSVWDHIVETYPEAISNVTVLKAPHHGRNSAYHQKAVKLMSPGCTVVSVGKKPSTDASQKYRQYSTKVLSTRWSGTIRFELNNQGSGHFFEEYERENSGVAAR